MKLSDDEFDTISQIADTVIYVEEEDDNKDPLRDRIIEFAVKSRDGLINKVKKELEDCKTEEEKVFINSGTTLFLLISIKEMLRDVDDDKIEIFANQMRDSILSLKED